MRKYFMKTERIGFSKWSKADINMATLLWGDEDVTKFISASGRFTVQDIKGRLETEMLNEESRRIQYWPFFEITSGEFIGCCGLRPFSSEHHSYEMGFHLRKEFWGMGYASEAAKKVIEYGFTALKADKLYAGHHPENRASQKLLTKLGFKHIGENFYKPTGLYHPSYELVSEVLSE